MSPRATEIIDRVGDVIADQVPILPDGREERRRIARAVIGAMRPPTEDMIRAAQSADHAYRLMALSGRAHLGPESIYDAMIAAALGERQ